MTRFWLSAALVGLLVHMPARAQVAAMPVQPDAAAPTESQAAPADPAAGPVPEAAALRRPPPLVVPDPATVQMPKLAFTATPVDEAAYDKYFYFHRDDTPFEEAYADIRECDALSSGISFFAGNSVAANAAMYQYGVLGSAIGGAFGSVLADLIHGSAARRKIRRINMRNCMGFKGYQRYGLNKDLWEIFNFEEGNGRKEEDVREAGLSQQAKVASGPKPQQKALDL